MALEGLKLYTKSEIRDRYPSEDCRVWKYWHQRDIISIWAGEAQTRETVFGCLNHYHFILYLIDDT